MRCWLCGIEPTGLVDVTTLNEVGPRYAPTGWPHGDHKHAERPPTPSELSVAGDAALQRVIRAWSD